MAKSVRAAAPAKSDSIIPSPATVHVEGKRTQRHGLSADRYSSIKEYAGFAARCSALVRDNSSPLFRLAQREHQAIGPVEEGCGVDQVGDREIPEAETAQRGDVLGTEGDGRRRQRHRGRDNRGPERVDIGCHAFVEQALDIVVALGERRGEARMDRGAVDAAIAARHGRRRQLALGDVGTPALLNATATDAQARGQAVQARAARLADTVALFQAAGGGVSGG